MLLLLSLRAPKRECESPVRESSEPWNQSTDYPCPAFCFFGHSKETFLFNALPQEDRGCDLNNYCSKANSGEGRSSQKLCVGFRTRCSPGVCLQAEHLRRWCIRSLRLSREEAVDQITLLCPRIPVCQSRLYLDMIMTAEATVRFRGIIQIIVVVEKYVT